jgi:hypothetical protein
MCQFVRTRINFINSCALLLLLGIFFGEMETHVPFYILHLSPNLGGIKELYLAVGDW